MRDTVVTFLKLFTRFFFMVFQKVIAFEMANLKVEYGLFLTVMNANQVIKTQFMK